MMTAITWFMAGCVASTGTLLLLAQWLARRNEGVQRNFQAELMDAWCRRNIAAERAAVATERIARALDAKGG